MPTSGRRFEGRCLAAGSARGEVVVLDEPLSLWGGMDVATGRIIDPHHPQAGVYLAGKVLVMPAGRGSSSSSSVLAEAVRLQTAPAAILLLHPDSIVALGAVVAGELYGREVPVVVLGPDHYARLVTGLEVAVEAAGERATLDVYVAPR